jgi:hypothetical protein
MTSKTTSKSLPRSVVRIDVRHYPVRYSIRDYTFPTVDTIKGIRFDDTHIHIELTDERMLAIPLRWIPPLRDASPQEREKYKISEDRNAIIWDPEESEVNEILRLSDYLTARPRLPIEG